MHWAAGFLGVPLIWRWYRFWVYFTAHGTVERGLWEKEQVGVLYLPGAAGVYSRGRAVQFHFDHTHHA